MGKSICHLEKMLSEAIKVSDYELTLNSLWLQWNYGSVNCKVHVQ